MKPYSVLKTPNTGKIDKSVRIF